MRAVVKLTIPVPAPWLGTLLFLFPPPAIGRPPALKVLAVADRDERRVLRHRDWEAGDPEGWQGDVGCFLALLPPADTVGAGAHIAPITRRSAEVLVSPCQL